ncbi:hypothetical protein GGR53DRAFT_468610 [Hypoxylon sp. FL1150]|nr:hypothetical protein GGR53DRAFT_468610 [Hypoxylon sp. FL1150]
MAAAQMLDIIPFVPTTYKYSGYRKLHQELRRRILDYRAAPRNSMPPPKPMFLGFEPAPTFLLASSAAKHDPADKEGWNSDHEKADNGNRKREAEKFTCGPEGMQRLNRS